MAKMLNCACFYAIYLIIVGSVVNPCLFGHFCQLEVVLICIIYLIIIIDQYIDL